jgi:hypothetical protein
MEVRYAAIDEPLLEDCLLMIYIISNDGTVEFEELRFGFMVGILAGGRQDSQDDLVGYLEEHDLAFSYDSDDQGSPGWVPVSDSINVGFTGFKFIKTPGDLGLASLAEFSPPGAVRMRDDVALWTRMSSGIDLLDDVEGNDSDYIVAIGGFQLEPGTTDTIVAAFIAGATYADMIAKAEYIQAFYDGELNGPREDHRAGIPYQTRLRSNHPNPFNPVTDIEYSIAKAGNVTLSVYDILGREVDVLVSDRQSAGTYTATFDGAGRSSGVYIYRLQAGDFSQSRKMVLLK